MREQRGKKRKIEKERIVSSVRVRARVRFVQINPCVMKISNNCINSILLLFYFTDFSSSDHCCQQHKTQNRKKYDN